MSYRQARVKAGLSIAEAAKRINVTRATIWLWETGKGNPLLDNLKKMAEVYGCTVADLVREESA